MSTGKRLGLFPFLDTRLKAILARAGFHAAAPPGSGPPREAWSPEVWAVYQSNYPVRMVSPHLLPLAEFHRRLSAEIAKAAAAKEPLTVVVFQLPLFPAGQERRRKELEIMLRLEVRRGDLVGRLAPHTVAVLLQTRQGGRAAHRLVGLLTKLAGEPVPAGGAHLSLDGQSAYELLRVATWRSLGNGTQAKPDAELKRLFGEWGDSQPAR